MSYLQREDEAAREEASICHVWVLEARAVRSGFLGEEVKCPVCEKDTGVYYWPSALDPLVVDVLEYLLYQRSYPGKPEYISERCEQCFDKEVEVRGFSLIELLIVLATLGIVAAVVIPAVARLLEGC